MKTPFATLSILLGLLIASASAATAQPLPPPAGDVVDNADGAVSALVDVVVVLIDEAASVIEDIIYQLCSVSDCGAHWVAFLEALLEQLTALLEPVVDWVHDIVNRLCQVSDCGGRLISFVEDVLALVTALIGPISAVADDACRQLIDDCGGP